jgi:hypothetical protein
MYSEDNCGNKFSTSQVISYTVDSKAPTFTAPANISIEKDANCNYNANPSITGQPANVNDNCDASIAVTYTDVQATGSNPNELVITRTWKVEDDCRNSSTQTQTITVKDVTAPVITNLSVNPISLWPPNHKMRDVTITCNSNDACGTSTNCVVTSVSSNEPPNALGDGNTEPDWEIVSPTLVRLRAERSGTGEGRVYTITVACTDAAGNRTTASTEVRVAHNITGQVPGHAVKIGSTINMTGAFWDVAGNKHTAKWLIDGTSVMEL